LRTGSVPFASLIVPLSGAADGPPGVRTVPVPGTVRSPNDPAGLLTASPLPGKLGKRCVGFMTTEEFSPVDGTEVVCDSNTAKTTMNPSPTRSPTFVSRVI